MQNRFYQPVYVLEYSSLSLFIFDLFFQSAFSVRLAEYGFNFYSLFKPDLLHEFELGVWKATLTHLLRVLYAFGGDRINELNAR